MAKLNSKAKIVALSAVVASTGVVAYASNEASKKDEQQNVDTANLIVEKIGKDRVKLSVDNVGNAVKAFQLSLKIDGNVKFNDGEINWLTKIDDKTKNDEKPVETDYVLSNNNKEIDIFVASNSELNKKGSVLEICEIDLVNAGAKSNSSYKIVPNTDNGKVAFKSVDTNNNNVEEANMGFDDTTLSINTAPTISLKDPKEDEVSVDVDNKIIKVKEGYDFNSNAKSFVEVSDDEDESISVDNVTVTKVDTSKSGTHNVEYTVTDSANESTKLSVSVLVEPEVWEGEPTLTGVPQKVTVYTGDVFNPLEPEKDALITAKDVKDNPIEVDVEYSADFDLNNPGNYTITYTAKDRFNNTKTETMALEVLQDEAPVITGVDDKVINKGESFDEKDGVKATDNGNDLTNQITISGKVNTNVAKEYKLTYKVSDGRNTVTKARKVTVNGAPTISGNLSDITIKNGSKLTEDDILKRINVNDDIDDKPKVDVDLSEVNTSQDGTYKVKIKATDSNNLSTEKEINVVVTSKSIEKLPDSGDGKTEDKPMKFKVIDESGIKEINEDFDSFITSMDIKLSNKSDNGDNVVYSIEVSDKPVAIEGMVAEKWFVDITVPKAIDDKGGIVIPQDQGVKVSSIKLNGYTGPLKVGDSIVLTPEINPENADNKYLAWSYREGDIKLKHYSGQSVEITALREGVTKVRAASVDGSKVYAEIEVQVGDNVKPDTEKPKFIYNGKTDINVANGMDFKVPTVTATDNVDVYTEVKATIVDPNGNKTTVNPNANDGTNKINTKLAGTHKITYTAEDSAGNKADEFIITVTVGEPMSGVIVGNGDAATEATALEMAIEPNVETLTNLVDAVKKGFDAETTGKPVIDGDKAIYTIKLSKKQGLITRLFNLNKNTETYYIKITVDNKPEFTNILDKFNTDGSTTNPPVTPSVPETSVTQLIGAKRFDTAAKISQEGWNTSANVILVNGNNRNLVDGLTAAPLASAKDAPILLSYDDKLPQETIDEIKRLKASNVILIGGETAIPQSVVNQVKAIGSNINVQRIGGLNRYETSLNIAKEIDKINDITKVYIGAGDGEADSLSISPVAGREKSPIILTNKDALDKNTFEYLRSENISDAYFIGGERKISDSVVSQVNSITSNDVSRNRIEGERRKDTNAKVIEKFYSDAQLDGIVVAKDLELVDALTVGPLAAKKNIPVVIATDELSKSQDDILKNKKSPKIYEVGGGIKSSVVDKLKQLLNNKK